MSVSSVYRSEKFRKLAGFGFWILLLKFLRQATALGATMALVRTISKESFGDYQFVLTIIGICAIFCLPGMQNVIVQSVARGYPGTFKAANFWSWRVSFLGSVVLLGLGVAKWFAGNAQLGVAFAVAAVLFPQSNGILNWQSYQNGREQFKLTALYQGASLVVGNGLIIAGCLLGWTQIWIPIALYFGVMAVQNVRMTRGILREIPSDAEPEPGSVPYGFRVSIYSVANVVGNYLDRVLLFLFVSPEVLATYAVADRIPELFKKNLQSLTYAIIPDLSRRSHYSRALDRKFNRAGWILCGGVFVGIFFVIPWLLPMLYTEEFRDAVLYCQMLLFSMAIGMFATLKFSYIQAKMDERGFRGVTLTMSVARIVLSLVLVPLYGAFGAALATIGYRIVTFSVVHYYLRKYHMVADAPEETGA